MNKKLIATTLLSLITYNVADASSDSDADLRELLGEDSYNFKIVTTPVKTKMPTGDIVSPSYVKAASKRNIAERELESTKLEVKRLSDSLEQLSENSRTQKEDLEEKIRSLRSLQGKLLTKYKALEESAINFEASTAVKMRITEKVQEIKETFKQELGEESSYTDKRYAIECVALRIISYVDSKEKREQIGLDAIYNEILSSLISVSIINTFSLEQKYIDFLIDLFKKSYEKEIQKFNTISVDQNDDNHVSDDDLIGHL